MAQDQARKLVFEILSKEQRHRLLEDHQLDFAVDREAIGRFRASAMFHNRGLSAVFRRIPYKIPSLELEALGLPPVAKTILDNHQGLILVTGATGQGKSTTLASIKRCVFTQREIGAHANSFADALRVAGREDPDIILVGEMRDLETISLALTCAELGILVFGTLHTNSAAKTIDRISNAFPSNQQAQARTMLSESLRAVVAQQLVRTMDGKGRCAANEILIGSSALASMIREGKITQIESLIQTGTKSGMQTMDQHLMKLVKEEKISREAAYEKAIDKKLFKLCEK